MRIPFLLAIVGVTSSLAHADAKRDKQMRFVHAAIAKGGDAVKSLVKRFPLYIQGLHFGDATCETSFGRSRHVEESELAALVDCMKGLRLAFVGGVFVADPGVEIDALFDDGKLTGFTSSEEVRATHAEKQLAATANIKPDAKSLAGVGKKVPFLAVDIALCVAADGSVESASVERYNRVEAGTWADQILATTKTTVYKPFMRQGTPARVCTHQLHVHPATKRKAGLAELARLEREAEEGEVGGVEGGVAGGTWSGVEGGVFGGSSNGPPPPPPPPPPPAPPQNVPPTLLEGSRISGSRVIVPDDETKKKIMQSGKDKVIGAFKLCIDPMGDVKSVTKLKGTGFADYDTAILREMRVWKYRPYFVNGKAVPVCTVITFIYSQK